MIIRESKKKSKDFQSVSLDILKSCINFNDGNEGVGVEQSDNKIKVLINENEFKEKKWRKYHKRKW